MTGPETASPPRDLVALRASLAADAPHPGLSSPLQALWWAAKGAWDKAHACAQDDESAAGSWVHAFLHRREGDLPNASYWYRRAGRPTASGSLDDEWNTIAGSLLATG
jgi:hypothetical protein